MKSIVLTGPESTGKTWLAGLLAGHFNTTWVPEYLREYVNAYHNVAKENMKLVATRQIQKEYEALQTKLHPVFFDTNIVTNKIYYQYYFGETPDWFEQLYNPDNYGHYLLLDTSVPWIEDEQRDSPEVREELYHLFTKELHDRDVSYTIISGDYVQRKQQAIAVVEQLLQSS